MDHPTSKCSGSCKICTVKLKNLSFDTQDMFEVLKLWGLNLKDVHKEVNIEGSPERTEYRVVCEDTLGDLYIVGKIPRALYDRKKRIALTLEHLREKGLQKIESFLINLNGEFVSEYNHCFWQIVHYVEGIDLPRPDYVFDKWRGSQLADFYIDLKERSADLPSLKSSEVFSIKDYVYDLINTIKENKPEMLERLLPVLEFLERDFMTAHDSFPVSFCHGDYHMLNMVWGESQINAVIDWEFSGSKPEIYDVANMLGCLGIEHPNSLTNELVIEFLSKLKEAGLFSEISWKYLLEFVVAQRFAWLSEWLRKDDLEMQDLEEYYIKLLIEKKDVLKNCWNSLSCSKEELICLS
ncbi:MAG: hypothetical protein A2306_02365 [Omnitrophica WOR_2 bacterium RIFOXYB2_FULL_38_16]|nr:MAG: hypothetical protein A2306_02365 [Omnitrophica WOR_2 bacterium RIFOXYB2_FULL_38_16]